MQRQARFAMSGSRELWTVVRQALAIVENGNIPEAKSVVQTLKAEGITAGMHVGRATKDFTSAMVAEWVLSGLVDIVENESWYGVNSWINVASHQAQIWTP